MRGMNGLAMLASFGSVLERLQSALRSAGVYLG